MLVYCISLSFTAFSPFLFFFFTYSFCVYNIAHLPKIMYACLLYFSFFYSLFSFSFLLFYIFFLRIQYCTFTKNNVCLFIVFLFLLQPFLLFFSTYSFCVYNIAHLPKIMYAYCISLSFTAFSPFLHILRIQYCTVTKNNVCLFIVFLFLLQPFLASFGLLSLLFKCRIVCRGSCSRRAART